MSQFSAEVRKERGEDYEPDSLRVMQAALERHLKSKLYPKSIIRDREFLSSRKVLEGKARKLREEGRGKRPNRSKSLTNEEEETFWKSGQLGSGNLRAIINTMWWLLTYLRSRPYEFPTQDKGSYSHSKRTTFFESTITSCKSKAILIIFTLSSFLLLLA